MICRLDALPELESAPSGGPRMVLALTDSGDYRQLCGRRGDGPYTVYVSRRPEGV